MGRTGVLQKHGVVQEACIFQNLQLIHIVSIASACAGLATENIHVYEMLSIFMLVRMCSIHRHVLMLPIYSDYRSCAACAWHLNRLFMPVL